MRALPLSIGTIPYVLLFKCSACDFLDPNDDLAVAGTQSRTSLAKRAFR